MNVMHKSYKSSISLLCITCPHMSHVACRIGLPLVLFPVGPIES